MPGRKSIVIAGASSGIGAALARALASDGHQLYICARRMERLAEVAEGRESIFYARCDVAEEPDVERFFRKVAERTNSIDAVIFCSGILGPLGRAHEVDSDAWLATLRTNLFGAFLVVKHAVPLMQPEHRPRILLLSGGGAFDPMPHASAYGVSKAGIVRLVETLATELAPRNIAVNAIAPGFVATEIHRSTFAAGPDQAGEHYKATVRAHAEPHDSIDLPIDCIRYMISTDSSKLTGKTISARFDPWGEPEFAERIDEIQTSPLYRTRRTNLDDLKDASLAEPLARAAARKQERRKVAANGGGRRATASSRSQS